MIKRESFLLGAIRSSERFEKLPGEDIIRLNNDAQLLRVGDTIFVLNLKMLERNMGFSALIQQAATETVSAIEELDILDDIEVLVFLLISRISSQVYFVPIITKKMKGVVIWTLMCLIF